MEPAPELFPVTCGYTVPFRSLRSYGEKKGYLGEGITGEVYAYGENYAVKRYFKYTPPLLRETSSILSLDNPHVIRLLDIIPGPTLNITYLVMPRATMNLGEFIKKGIPRDKLWDYVYQICEGVCYNLQRDVWHRDLKPQNILYFASDDRFVITDYGIARTNSCNDPTYTYTNPIYTLWYRPPEILLGETRYDPPADVWALGCVLAEMILMQPLFVSASPQGQLLVIFQLLGTPSREQWPEARHYPFWKEYAARWRTLRSTFTEVFSLAKETQPLLVDLIAKMLVYNQENRIPYWKILSHPYFEGRSNPISYLSCRQSMKLKACYPSEFDSRYLEVRADLFQRMSERVSSLKINLRSYFLMAYVYDTTAEKFPDFLPNRFGRNLFALVSLSLSVDYLVTSAKTFISDGELQGDLIIEGDLDLAKRQVLKAVGYNFNIATSGEFFLDANPFNRKLKQRKELVQDVYCINLLLLSSILEVPFHYSPSVISDACIELTAIRYGQMDVPPGGWNVLHMEIINSLLEPYRVFNKKNWDILDLNPEGEYIFFVRKFEESAKQKGNAS